MSLYHETAEVLSASGPAGGNLKTRIFGKKDLKTSQQQIYALAVETCKWSPVLKEVIENADILRVERKLNPILAVLLVHDFLLAKQGIALPATHGLRASVERHKARLTSEFTRSRLRRKAPSVDVLRQQIEADYAVNSGAHPRWVRVNTLLTTLEDQLESTFKEFTRVYVVGDVISGLGKTMYLDEHIPNLIAITPGFEISKTDAYKTGKIILQDKASCFPAYLLDPYSEDGDVIDSCAAPGNKTTHLAAIVHSRIPEGEDNHSTVYAFEKDRHRAKTLEKMVQLAGAKDITRISIGQDFLKVDPKAALFKNVGALLLDPSCSGSGIVGRDVRPTVHLPVAPDAKAQKSGQKPAHKPGNSQGRKRKRDETTPGEDSPPVVVDDDGKQTVLSEQELAARLDALSSFQLILLEHAFKFPSAKKLTYSTCSVHAQENEQVVLKALKSDIAKQRGWRILTRDRQIRGMKDWPVRGSVDAADGNAIVAEACIRSYKDDGRGVMGFFVAAFVRDGEQSIADDDEPYVRDEDGRIVRDMFGMPMLKPDHATTAAAAAAPDHTRQAVGHVLVTGADDAEMDSDSDSDSASDDSAGNSESVDDEEWGGFGD
ncbi:NOL1/NOP2/sun family protein [Pseudomassariella vexata]|uniref:NOL1/NOP2/sun family protein n=1 Tax=Pseudomassariella vexata TaxID=1141098 RepID=A0A1Y2EES0_9PEZI|nr:NOL1/NOP2/sun family protein [Pseudomassariella vexata]ORY70060.1 NOL1/NOP2/sun family protein [Pseudomassariella vexata]